MEEPKCNECTREIGCYECGYKAAGNKSAFSAGLSAVALAKRFHETYEYLAPKFNYNTREESASPWDEVPEANKKLMIATCAEILKQGI